MVTRYKINSRTGIFMWAILFILFLYSAGTNAQGLETESNSLITSENTGKPTYVGYSISAGTQSYTLSSNLPRLNGLTVTREGGSIGAVAGNDRGAIRSTLGLFYSSPSVPYSIDVVEIGLSGYVYLLRMNKIKYHTIEPYFSLSTKGIKSGFYDDFSESRTKKNNSTSQEKLEGSVNSLQGFVGIGAEYQLTSESNHFLHFFMEVRYGMTFANYSASNALSQTSTSNPMSFALGVNFGKIKYK
jgi:hypothetical protein